MTTDETTIQDFLGHLPPFDRLPERSRDKVAKQLQLRTYSMGEEILVGTALPSEVLIIYQGYARLLGYESKTRMPVALKLLEAGAILGWASLLRGVATETAIASTDVATLTLPASTFLKLLSKHHEIAQYFEQHASESEVFELFGQYIQKQAKKIPNALYLVQQAYPDAVICNFPAGQTVLRNQLDANYLWFVSCGEVVALSESGATPAVYLPLDKSDFRIIGDRPARLLGILKSPALEEAGIIQTSKPETQKRQEEPGIQNEETERENRDEEEEQSVQSLEFHLQRQGEGEQRRERRTEVEKPASSPVAKTSNAKTNYPFVRGRRGAIDTSIACLTMVSQYFGVPLRREVMNRVLSDRLQGRDRASLAVCGAVIELMGLHAQLMNVPARAAARIQAPALIGWKDSIAVLWEASDRGFVLSDPKEGAIAYTPEEFAQHWNKTTRVLLIQAGKETPRQRFGWQWFLPSLHRYRKVLFLVLIASFFVQLATLANPLIVQLIIDQVIVKGSFETLNTLGLFLLIVAIFEALLGSLRTYLFVDTTNRIDLTLGTRIIDHLLRLPLPYFEKRPVGELSSRINELENIRSFLTGTALTAVLDAVFSVIYIVVMLIYSWQLTIAGLATVPLFILMTWFFSPVIRQQLRAKAEQNAQTQSYLVEVLSGIQTVKAQNIEARSRSSWQSRYARYVSSGFKTVISSTTANSIGNFLNKVSGLLVLWFGASLVLKGDLTLGQLIAFRIIAGYVTGPILRLGQLWQNLQETSLSLERIADIIDHNRESEKDRTNIPMPNIQGTVTYENVAFRFRSGERLQLDNVNLEIPAGQFVGVVGQSGAGKSTLTKLLVRLYDPEGGRILIDDYDISKVELYSLRQQIGVVPQETLLFDGTVEENIALTNPDATTDDIIQAAKIAVAHEFIMNLPNGYNTRVGERGSALSGGQRQRIAIARTILQYPRMLILDEATSALDYQTERQVCDNLARTFSNMTVFFITHRLGTVRNADRILVMDKGRVAESGSHDELMTMKGRYFVLSQHQEFVLG